jgi:hypothetical protein
MKEFFFKRDFAGFDADSVAVSFAPGNGFDACPPRDYCGDEGT